MSKNKRIFSCPECGVSYEAYPPSDDYNRVSLKSPDKEDYNEKIGVLKVVHDCNNDQCKHPVELYWYREKIGVGVF